MPGVWRHTFMRRCLGPHLLPGGKTCHDRPRIRAKVPDEDFEFVRASTTMTLQATRCRRQGVNAVSPFIDRGYGASRQVWAMSYSSRYP